MKFFISFGAFDLKYLTYYIFFGIFDIYIIFYIDYFDERNNMIIKHKLLDSLCYYIGYLLNFIPTWINHKNSKTQKEPIINGLKEGKMKSIEYIYNNPYNGYLSAKDIIKFVFICLLLLLTDLIEVIINIISPKNTKKEDEKEYDINLNFC